MKSMKPLIIANWKMNPANSREAFDLAGAVTKGVQGLEADVVLCPPFVFVPQLISSANVFIGAQDCFWEDQGPYTGEVSPAMLRNLGCTYVILGHSEREQFLNETMDMVQQKVKSTLIAELVPVVCLGDYDADDRNSELGAKMRGILEGLSAADLSKLVLVYEPVWAISTNPGARPATLIDIKEAVTFMRSVLQEMFGQVIAKNTTILYGGSVDSKNIMEFLREDITQGALVGGTSLDAKEFIALVRNAALV